MKICVIGAGAIGGLLAAKLAHAGEDVSVIARGAHLVSIVENGLSLLEEGQEIVAGEICGDDEGRRRFEFAATLWPTSTLRQTTVPSIGETISV